MTNNPSLMEIGQADRIEINVRGEVREVEVRKVNVSSRTVLVAYPNTTSSIALFDDITEEINANDVHRIIE